MAQGIPSHGAAVSLDIAPPLTRTERIAVLIMALAAVLAALGIVSLAEVETRRATRAWPPHVTQDMILSTRRNPGRKA